MADNRHLYPQVKDTDYDYQERLAILSEGGMNEFHARNKARKEIAARRKAEADHPQRQREV